MKYEERKRNQKIDLFKSMMDNAAKCYEATVKHMESDDARFKLFQHYTNNMAAGLQGLNAGSCNYRALQ